VKVHYQNVRGVRVAHRIDQEDIVFGGHVTAINPEERIIIVQRWPLIDRSFVMAEDCAVVLANDEAGSLDDLAIGHSVNIIYEPWEDRRLTHRIEREGVAFAGTIQSVNAEARSVEVNGPEGAKKFILADDCKIVIGGKAKGDLDDLHAGAEATFNYEDANGVLVANRLELESESSHAKEEGPQTAKLDLESQRQRHTPGRGESARELH